MQNIGYVTLNISLVIYLVHFVPQMVHNKFKHKIFEISLWTHSLMIFANAFDLVYAIGFNLEWQYILVGVILLVFLIVQQFQILANRKNQFMVLHTIFILSFLLLVPVLIFIIELHKNYLLTLGLISGIIYNIYWLPQIYKNYCQKQAEGFSIIFLLLSWISTLCDIVSAIFLEWPVLSVITAFCLSVLILIQIFQYFFYKKSFV